MIKNYIFDVDRTLIDSYRVELETLKQALFIVTNNLYNDNIMNQLTVLTTKEFFHKLGIDLASDEMKMINRHWTRLLKERKLKFFEGARELLVEIKNKECFLGIVTSRTMEELEEIDTLMDVIDLFDAVVTSDLVKYPKPHPESLNLIINKFNLNNEQTIYIGDSISDQKIAKNANVKFGLASWENKNELTEYDYIFKSPQSIYKLFKRED